MIEYSLRNLECFVAAADAGTISGAAAATGTSASAVAAGIAELEKRLGVQLLIRQQAKGVFLTGAGSRLLPDARFLLAQATDLASSARREGTEPAGHLAIGCYTTLAPFFVPPLLDDFVRRHPRVTVDIVDGSQDEMHDRLLSGRVEAAILYDHGLGPHLTYTVVRRCRPHLIFGASHPLANRASVKLSEVADEPLIAFDVPPSLQNSEEVLRAAGHEPNVAYRASNIELVRSLVGRGLGYAVLVQPWPTNVSYEGEPVVPCAISDDIDEYRVVLAFPDGARVTSRAAALAKFCVEHFSSPRGG